MRETILNGDEATACVVAEKDGDAFADAIGRLYRGTRNIDGGLREKILSRYNQKTNTATILALYKRLVGPSGQVAVQDASRGCSIVK